MLLANPIRRFLKPDEGGGEVGLLTKVAVS